MRIMAVILLILAQFTVFPFFGRITANTMRQFRDAAHDTQDITKSEIVNGLIIGKTAEM